MTLPTVEEQYFVKMLWSAPCSRSDALRRNGVDDVGVYQIYGHHVVFGPGSLLYIGKATDSFAARFTKHEAWLRFESDVQIRLGTLAEPRATSTTERNRLIGHAEALTIYWHSPPYNSHFIVRYGGPALRIQNHGDRGRLLPEYSSRWDAPRPEDD